MVKSFAKTLALLCVLSLTACAHKAPGTVTTGTSKKVTEARCAGLRHLSFTVNGDADSDEKHGDTHRTIGEIEVHNKVLDGKGCPDKPSKRD